MRDRVIGILHRIVLAIVCVFWIATPAAAEISILCGTEGNTFNETRYSGNITTHTKQLPARISTPSVLRCNTTDSQASFNGAVWPDDAPFSATSEAQAHFKLTTNGGISIIESRGTSKTEFYSGAQDYPYFARSEIAIQSTIIITSDKPLYYRFLPIPGQSQEFPDFSFISSAGESLSNGELEGVIANTDGVGNVEFKIASNASAVHEITDTSTIGGDLGPSWNFRLMVTPVPEPSTQLMLLSGLLGIGFWGRKRFSI